MANDTQKKDAKTVKLSTHRSENAGIIAVVPADEHWNTVLNSITLQSYTLIHETHEAPGPISLFSTGEIMHIQQQHVVFPCSSWYKDHQWLYLSSGHFRRHESVTTFEGRKNRGTETLRLKVPTNLEFKIPCSGVLVIMQHFSWSGLSSCGHQPLLWLRWQLFGMNPPDRKPKLTSLVPCWHLACNKPFHRQAMKAHHSDNRLIKSFSLQEPG